MKTMSNLGQNFPSCMQAGLYWAWKPGVVKGEGGGERKGFREGGLRQTGQVYGYQLIPANLVPQGIAPEGWGGSQREALWSVKLAIFFAGQALATHAL